MDRPEFSNRSDHVDPPNGAGAQVEATGPCIDDRVEESLVGQSAGGDGEEIGTGEQDVGSVGGERRLSGSLHHEVASIDEIVDP